MKKALVFAAVIAFGGAAMAQDTQPQSTPSAAPAANRPTEPMPDSGTMAPPSPTDTPTPAPAPAPDVTPPDASTPPAPADAPTPPDAATTPDTAAAPAPAPAPAPTADASTKTYPKCTRKITDNCINPRGK